MTFQTYRSNSTMDEIKSINSLSDAERFLESKGVPRFEAYSIVKKMQRAIINDNIQAITNFLARPDAFH